MSETTKAALYWSRCLEFIKDNLVNSQSAFEYLFLPIKPLKFENNEMILGVKSPFIYEYLEEHYAGLIGAAFSKVIGEGITLVYSVITDQSNNIAMNLVGTSQTVDSVPPYPQKDLNKTPNPHSSRSVTEFNPQLNARYSFDNFIKGVSNELACTVGESVAQYPAQQAFNPLFIYGHSGVGKTHLVNAIGDKVRKLHPQKRVLYVSANLFQHQYTDAVRHNRVNDFISFYQTIDVLIIDDIQEFTALTKTQNTFFHIFNHLHQNNKQLIMTCDREPSELQGIEERLLTRFKWGLVAELERPDTELRRNILRNKIRQDGLVIPENVIEFIATNVSEGVRELEGVIHSLLARSILLKREIDLELTQRIVKKVVKIAELKPATIEVIIEKVCAYYNIDMHRLHENSRKREVVRARQMAMFLAEKHTTLSMAKIGKMIGGKNYATVIHACKTIKEQAEVDKIFKTELQELEKSLVAV